MSTLRRPPGQATAEYVGVVAAVVLAFAATTAWLVGSVRPPDSPPDVVSLAAGPLQDAPPILLWQAPSQAVRAGGDEEPIRAFLRAVAGGEGAPQAWRDYLRYRVEWDRAFGARLWQRAREALEDPAAALPDPSVLTPAGLARAAWQQGMRPVEYVRYLRSLPPGERWAAFRRDSAVVAADGTFQAVGALARRGAGRLARPRTPAPPPPAQGAPAP